MAIVSIMPYIDQAARERIDKGERPQNAGELNYTISKIIDAYVIDKGGIRYSHLNEAIGALECAKLEIYRRLAAPYEDLKIEQSGDVFEVLEEGD